MNSSAKQVLAVWNRNIFPDMNVTWGKYPINIGHTDFPGCFRCHDGGHNSKDNTSITQDCNACHNLLAMDEANPKILTDLGISKVTALLFERKAGVLQRAPAAVEGNDASCSPFFEGCRRRGRNGNRRRNKAPFRWSYPDTWSRYPARSCRGSGERRRPRVEAANSLSSRVSTRTCFSPEATIFL